MKISGIEKKILDYLERHRWLFLYIAVTLLSMVARFSLRGVISGDMEWFLLPWASVLKENGGILALNKQVGNYGVLYQTIIALMTYLPVQYEYAYKIFSILFDYALASVCAAMIREMTGSRLKTFLTYAFVIMLPSVVLNSSAWGQCDSVYVFFCILCIWLLVKEKYTFAFLSFGMAFSFKLQAIFLAPFLILWYLKERKFSLFNFLLIPMVMIVTSLVGILEGRSILSPLQIYLDQTGFYSSLHMNYPSFWALMTTSDADGVFQKYSWFCITSTLMVLLAELAVFLKRKAHFSQRSTLFAAFVMTYSCVLFLPDMHERYSYLYMILGLMLSVLEPQTLLSFIFLVLLDLQTYGAFLFDPVRYPSSAATMANPVPYPFINVMSAVNVLCLLSYILFWRKRFFSSVPDSSAQKLAFSELRSTGTGEKKQIRKEATVE